MAIRNVLPLFLALVNKIIVANTNLIKMRIKNYPNGNRYILTPEKMWVRDFTRENVPFIDINETINENDHFLFVENEFENNLKRYSWVDSEKFNFKNVIIVCDGLDFKNFHKKLEEVDKEVLIIGVNGSLKKWECSRRMNFYVVNNPYEQCMSYLPIKKGIMPKCIASCRTNFNFLNMYNGDKFRYSPTREKSYSGTGYKESSWCIDDYRNSICAALNISFKFGVEKIMLFSCNDFFKEARPGAVKIDSELWAYPQQLAAKNLIDSNLFWLKNYEIRKIEIKEFSKNKVYKNADHFHDDNEAISWFKNEKL